MLPLLQKLFSEWPITTPIFFGIAFALSRCVLDADGEPLMTQDEWEAWGTEHVEAAIRLFVVVKRLSLLERSDVEKKSESTPS